MTAGLLRISESAGKTRGRNMSDTFDLGTMLPHLAALAGRQSFDILVLPGVDSQIARFNLVDWSHQSVPTKDGYVKGLEPIISAAHLRAHGGGLSAH